MPESPPGAYTVGEVRALIAPIMHHEPEDLIGYLILAPTTDGQLITMTSCTTRTAISVLLHAVDELLHAIPGD